MRRAGEADRQRQEEAQGSTSPCLSIRHHHDHHHPNKPDSMAMLRSPPNIPRVLSSHHSRSSPHSSRLRPLPCTIRKMIRPPLLPRVSRALPDNLADGTLDFRSRPSVSHPSPSSAIDFLTLCHRLKISNHGLGAKLAAIVGDITPSDGVPKAEKSKREQAALTEMCKILGGGCQAHEIKDLWEEYENNSSLEANLVKDFDKVEMILQALEYEIEHGKVLDEFFLSTAGKFQTRIGKSWAAEIISRRKSHFSAGYN